MFWATFWAMFFAHDVDARIFPSKTKNNSFKVMK
jgi:hypothetical protein